MTEVEGDDHDREHPGGVRLLGDRVGDERDQQRSVFCNRGSVRCVRSQCRGRHEDEADADTADGGERELADAARPGAPAPTAAPSATL